MAALTVDFRKHSGPTPADDIKIKIKIKIKIILFVTYTII